MMEPVAPLRRSWDICHRGLRCQTAGRPSPLIEPCDSTVAALPPHEAVESLVMHEAIRCSGGISMLDRISAVHGHLSRTMLCGKHDRSAGRKFFPAPIGRIGGDGGAEFATTGAILPRMSVDGAADLLPSPPTSDLMSSAMAANEVFCLHIQSHPVKKPKCIRSVYPTKSKIQCPNIH